MAHSSLLGIDPQNPGAPGRDDMALGPSDSSDSGSDIAGLETMDTDDPAAPVDQALADDAGRPLGGPEARGAGSDAAGTGERRSAGSDAGGREAGDISVDRVFSPFGEGEGEGDLPLPEEVEAAAIDTPGDEVEEDDEDTEDSGPDTEGEGFEDEAADPVGDGRSDAALAEAMDKLARGRRA